MELSLSFKLDVSLIERAALKLNGINAVPISVDCKLRSGLSGLSAFQDLVAHFAGFATRHPNAATPGQLYILMGHLMDIGMKKGELSDLVDLKLVKAFRAECEPVRGLLKGLQLEFTLVLDAERQLRIELAEFLAVLDPLFDATPENFEETLKGLEQTMKTYIVSCKTSVKA